MGFRVQGTKGLWMDVNHSIHIEGRSPPHQWEEFKKYRDEYEHPLWKQNADTAASAGHGGMDWFVIHAFVEALKAKAPMPIDIYDAVTLECDHAAERAVDRQQLPDAGVSGFYCWCVEDAQADLRVRW